MKESCRCRARARQDASLGLKFSGHRTNFYEHLLSINNIELMHGKSKGGKYVSTYVQGAYDRWLVFRYICRHVRYVLRTYRVTVQNGSSL